MVYRVVSTKLTEDEHSSLIDKCNKQGRSPSLFIKEAILERIESGNEEKPAAPKEVLKAFESKDERESDDRPSAEKITPESELMKFMRLCRAQRERNERIGLV
jgi:hypothetical protein